MKVRYARAAEADLAAAVEYYDGQSAGLGDSFLDEAESAEGRIASFPHAWQKLSANTRRCRLHRFPYGLIYRVTDDSAVIVAVAHLHSEPSQWLKRGEE
ncbi:MAG: type II toxin-antitoxin system RelE/ParE family toxin [Rhodomicrobium sp.]